MSFTNCDLTGKVAIVTGGSRGIGAAIALGLAEAGADVIASSRSQESVQKITERIRKLGRKSTAICLDVAKRESIENLVAEVIKNYGKIDILVNNAGINPIYKRAEKITEEEWDEIINVNLKGVFLCCQAVGRVMIRQKSGKIINIASINGLTGAGRAVPYCSAKGAIVLLTKSLALDWVQYNIHVNAIGPGLIETEFTSGIQKNRFLYEKMLSDIPQSRFGKPEEIVGVAILLGSDLSNYITGQTIFVDGGYTAM